MQEEKIKKCRVADGAETYIVMFAVLLKAVIEKAQAGYITNVWPALLRKTGMSLSWWIGNCNKMAGRVVAAGELQEADSMFWIGVTSPATHEAYTRGKQRDWTSLADNIYPDVLVVKGRTTKAS